MTISGQIICPADANAPPARRGVEKMVMAMTAMTEGRGVIRFMQVKFRPAFLENLFLFFLDRDGKRFFSAEKTANGHDGIRWRILAFDRVMVVIISGAGLSKKPRDNFMGIALKVKQIQGFFKFQPFNEY